MLYGILGSVLLCVVLRVKSNLVSYSGVVQWPSLSCLLSFHFSAVRENYSDQSCSHLREYQSFIDCVQLRGVILTDLTRSLKVLSKETRIIVLLMCQKHNPRYVFLCA